MTVAVGGGDRPGGEDRRAPAMCSVGIRHRRRAARRRRRAAGRRAGSARRSAAAAAARARARSAADGRSGVAAGVRLRDRSRGPVAGGRHAARRARSGDLAAGAPARPGERPGPAGARRLRPRRADPAGGRRARAARRPDAAGSRVRRPGGRARAGPRRGERVPLRGIRGAVAEKLSRSRREIPDATCWVDADATELMRARGRDERAPARPEDLPARAARPDLHGRAGPLPRAQLHGRHGAPGDRPARRTCTSGSPRRPSADWSCRSCGTRTRADAEALTRGDRPADRGGPGRHADPARNSPAARSR